MGSASRKPVIVLIAAGLCAAVAAWYFQPGAPPDDPLPPELPAERSWKSRLAEHFAGDAACRDCHAEQFAAHQRSGHSHTAHWMADTDLARRLDGTVYRDPLREYELKFERKSGRFFVSIPGRTDLNPLEVEWLLGSGTHAQTPVAVLEDENRGVEQRFTWFAERKALGLTPEHERFEPYEPGTVECYGRPLDPGGVRGCLSCHMTFGPLKNQPLRRDAFQANISCERCHGPRKAHVVDALAGRPERSKPLVRFDDASAYLKMCGQCHRDESNVDPSSSPAQRARFQPYGLQRSQCYQQTPGGFSCSKCHDPHDRVSRDSAGYNRACLSCHSAGGQTTCPKNPTSKCIDCHMPAVKFVEGVSFHDHHIRVPASDR